MGLNIGIHVITYEDNDPKQTAAEMEAEFFAYLREKFPGDNLFGGGWVSRKQIDEKGWSRIKWDFDVRMFGWGGNFNAAGYDSNAMYEAIFAFVLTKFGVDPGFDCEVYWSG